ncbi:hypothetical protein T07_6993 [Trichinella nelsoni]|uniref:Uncharacterized protein n=1 Tax=Trichinella nelsoni TaxID=6336 RepID=A0A0V0RAJ2_9BILA|nr:hypothetical protein T07_6993 [Trichinella nelsoni]
MEEDPDHPKSFTFCFGRMRRPRQLLFFIAS